MSQLVLATVIQGIRDLPSLPVVVMDLFSSFENPDASSSALASKISQDQALTAKTLRLANSSFYGLQRKVTTIQQAITVLGFDCVRTLVTAAGVIGNFSSSVQTGFSLTNFWRHAIGTALCARILARTLNLNQDHAFISGLLHDIGKLVLVSRFPEHYSKVIAYRNEYDCTVLDAERNVVGVDHALVGQALAEYWKFPSVIQLAIGNHHTPMPQDLGGMPCVIHVADAIIHALDLNGSDDDLVPFIMEKAWSSLNLNPAKLILVFRRTEEEFEEVCKILSS